MPTKKRQQETLQTTGFQELPYDSLIGAPGSNWLCYEGFRGSAVLMRSVITVVLACMWALSIGVSTAALCGPGTAIY